MEEVVYIKNRKGVKMAIKLNYAPERKKCVFLEHGLSARKEYPHMKVMEDFFAKHGYNVVNIDATNSLNESDNTPEGITFTGHYQDLEDAINWAKGQKFYHEPFALAGQSLGAASCIYLAGKYTQMVNLLIFAACPFIVGEDLINKDQMMMHIEKYGFLDKVSKSTGRTLRINKDFNDDVRTYDLADNIKNITAKTYVIQGLSDEQYIIENTKSIYDMLNCPKHLYLLENVPHDLANTPETKQVFTETLKQILSRQ